MTITHIGKKANVYNTTSIKGYRVMVVFPIKQKKRTIMHDYVRKCHASRMFNKYSKIYG